MGVDVHDLLELAKTLAVAARGAPARAGGGGLAIMTCSGGDSAQGADEAERLGLDAAGARRRQRASGCASCCPSAATAANPLDYTAMIWGDADALAELVQRSARTPRSTACSCSTTSPRT